MHCDVLCMFGSFAINSIKTKAENRCTITIQLAIYKVVALVTQEYELAFPPPPRQT